MPDPGIFGGPLDLEAGVGISKPVQSCVLKYGWGFPSAHTARFSVLWKRWGASAFLEFSREIQDTLAWFANSKLCMQESWYI